MTIALFVDDHHVHWPTRERLILYHDDYGDTNSWMLDTLRSAELFGVRNERTQRIEKGRAVKPTVARTSAPGAPGAPGMPG